MKKVELLERIEALERRIEELEAATATPIQLVRDITPPTWPMPEFNPLRIWCNTTTDYAADNPYGYL